MCDLHDPHMMRDMEARQHRLWRAIKTKELPPYGDYDVGLHNLGRPAHKKPDRSSRAEKRHIPCSAPLERRYGMRSEVVEEATFMA